MADRPQGFYFEDGSVEPFNLDDPFESKVSSFDQLQGILKALRYILECQEGESILYRATNVMRRYENLQKELAKQSTKEKSG